MFNGSLTGGLMMFRVASSMYIGIFTLVVLQLLWLIQEGGETV